MFQKITKLDYDFPDGFLVLAKDLVQKLLVCKTFKYKILHRKIFTSLP